MKIILEDFNFKGKHIDHYECDLPQLHEVDELFKERIGEYLIDSLNALNEEDI